MADMMELHILAANRVFYDGPAASVTVPAEDGEMQILPHRSKLIAAIVAGELRYRLPDEPDNIVAVGNGIIKVTGSEVLVLVDSAEKPEEVSAVRAQREMDEALEQLRQKQSIQEYKLAQANLARAAAALRVKHKPQA